MDITIGSDEYIEGDAAVVESCFAPARHVDMAPSILDAPGFPNEAGAKDEWLRDVIKKQRCARRAQVYLYYSRSRCVRIYICVGVQ